VFTTTCTHARAWHNGHRHDTVATAAGTNGTNNEHKERLPSGRRPGGPG
jgi:hypothetical protein